MSRLSAPDYDARRLATTSAFAALFAYAVIMCVTPASINEIARAYQANTSKLGLLYLVMFAAFFIAVQAGGWLSDRRGKLPIVGTGCALMCIGAGLVAGSVGFLFLTMAMLLMGTGGGFAEGVAMAAVSELYAGKRRTAMLNWSQVVFAVGAVSSPLAVGRVLAAGGDWRTAYIGAASVCAAGCMLAFLAGSRMKKKREMRADSDPRSDIQTDPAMTPGISFDSAPRTWCGLVRDPTILWLSIGLMLYVGAECGQANWLAVFFKHSLGSSRPLAASSVAYFWLGIGLGRMIATRLSRSMNDLAIIRGALALGAISQAVLLLMRSPAAAIANVVILGCCLAPTWPTVLSHAGRLYAEQTGTVFGIVVAAGALGAALFPPIIGKLADLLDIRTGLWLCFALLVINLAVFLGPAGKEK